MTDRVRAREQGMHYVMAQFPVCVYVMLVCVGFLVRTDGAPLCRFTADTTALSPWMHTGY